MASCCSIQLAEKSGNGMVFATGGVVRGCVPIAAAGRVLKALGGLFKGVSIGWEGVATAAEGAWISWLAAPESRVLSEKEAALYRCCLKSRRRVLRNQRCKDRKQKQIIVSDSGQY